MRLNKKGDIGDFLLMMVLFFSVLVTSLIAVRVFGSIMTNPGLEAQVNATQIGNTSIQVVDVMYGRDGRGGRLFDYMIIAFYFLTNIAVLLGSVLLPNVPAFVVVNLFFIIGSLIVSILFNNMMTSIFNAFNVTLPLTQLVINNLFILQLGFAILTFVILFISKRQQ